MSLYPEENGLYVLEKIGIDPEKHKDTVNGWGDSYSRMPEKVFFLENEFIGEKCKTLKMSESVFQELAGAAEIIRKNPALTAYVWHIYYRQVSVYHDGVPPANFWNYALPESIFKGPPQIIFLLAALGASEQIIEKYRSLHIPEDIISDTLDAAITKCVEAFCRTHDGHAGITVGNYSWMRLNLAGRLLVLGRFCFKLKEENDFGLVLKNRKNSRKIMLIQPGLKITKTGYCALEKDCFDLPVTAPEMQPAFTSTLEITDDSYCGYAVHPAGYVLPEKICLPKNEWEVILEPGDIMMDLHIPAGGGMTPEKTCDSLNKAFRFFSDHFPGKFKPAFISHSWIFNPQLEEKLPDSNLAKFMRECYLFPNYSSGQDGISYVFGRYPVKKEDFPQLPRVTSVQRTLLEILESGQYLRNGGMVYFAEDLPSFGTNSYRTQFQI